MTNIPLYIGTAGWAIPKRFMLEFSGEGSHLERYGHRFPSVEINTSFYRPHRPATYERWAATVPDDFRFAVKVPRSITHTKRWETPSEALIPFLKECSYLGHKLGPLLFQFPPRLSFTDGTIRNLFETLRACFTGEVVCEPRHASWFSAEADTLLSRYHIARVVADPAIVSQASTPGGWKNLVYYRLHGSPLIYTSAYSQAFLQTLITMVITQVQAGASVWCIFDNTAAGAATEDALTVLNMVSSYEQG